MFHVATGQQSKPLKDIWIPGIKLVIPRPEIKSAKDVDRERWANEALILIFEGNHFEKYCLGQQKYIFSKQ